MPARKVIATARATAALAASGAWDSAPTEIDCGAYDWAAVYLTYAVSATAVSATGFADFKIETTIDHDDWHPDGIVDNDSAVTAVANGLDQWRGEVHPYVIYHDTPGTTTGTQYVPKFRISLVDANAVRINAREAGELGKPGTVGITLMLVAEQ